MKQYTVPKVTKNRMCCNWEFYFSKIIGMRFSDILDWHCIHLLSQHESWSNKVQTLAINQINNIICIFIVTWCHLNMASCKLLYLLHILSKRIKNLKKPKKYIISGENSHGHWPRKSRLLPRKPVTDTGRESHGYFQGNQLRILPWKIVI